MGEAAPRAETAPAETSALLALARSTHVRGDPTGAAGLYRRAHELDPGAIEPLLGLGRVLRETGAPAEAALAYQSAAAIDPNDSEARRGLGLTLLEAGDTAGAVAELAAIAETVDDPRVFNALGVAHDMKSSHGAAQGWYRRGLAVAPGNLSLIANLGLSLALSGQAEKGVTLLERAVRDPGADPGHRQNLALVYGLLGRTDEAEALGLQDLDPGTVRENVAAYEALRSRLANPDAVAAGF